MATRISPSQASPRASESGGADDVRALPGLHAVGSPAAALRAITPAQGFVTLIKVAPFGSLQARRARNGTVTFYWRVNITVNGALRQRREVIGHHDPALPPKSRTPNGNNYSLAAAARRAEDLAEAHAAKRREGGILAIHQLEREAAELARAQAASDATHTLIDLLWDYADHLKRANRPSHRQVRSTIRRHIEPQTKVARKAARLVTPDDVADLMRVAHESGKARTANKVRSYIRAAYEIAKSARIDATVAASFKAYGIKTNPAAETRVVDVSSDMPRTIRALTSDQLRAYWNVICKVEGFRGALLRLHLWTGGQRIAQLLRLRVADIQSDYVTIYDGKGKSRVLRPHAVPLIPAARAALDDAMRERGIDDTAVYALSSDGGATPVHATTFSKWATDAVTKARKTGDPNAKALPADFSAKLVRSGAETALAANHTDKETRGRLQSHGISGVQDRHYNAHDYLEEKRGALETLHGLICVPRAA